ncbi:hypothetical protein M9H77_30658 [Catharanthus roseus]|uniref:Uncharacterized protein n=1 Tax=Catharanthus roseus TaxID=4058 RepID=A0ACB9ZY95_CATRO|nr:hypothetical protein M9H77_30658 [Catharanthus roseus]
MTRDAQETVDLLQGAQGGAFRGTKTLLFSRVQVEEAKGVSTEGFEASTPKEVKDTPTVDRKKPIDVIWKRHKNLENFRPEKVMGVNVIIMYGMKNYQREYDEYHEGYNHGAHTLEEYNIGVSGRDDCDGRWMYLRSMNTFYGNGSYGNEPIVERRLMDSGDIVEFWRTKQESRGKTCYNSLKIISFFPSNFYLCFEIYFKEIKLFLLAFVEHGDRFTSLNSLGTYLERRYYIEFNSISCAIPRVHDYDFNIANYVFCVLGVEYRRSMEKELGPILEDLSISLFINTSSLCYEVSLEELKSFLDSYNFQMSLIVICVLLLSKGTFSFLCHL